MGSKSALAEVVETTKSKKIAAKPKNKKRAVGKTASRSLTAKAKQEKVKKKKAKLKSKMTRKQIDKLVIDHQEHGKRLAWSFLTSWRIRLPQDEVISVVGAALCEAANRFDPDRGVDFKTFFFYHLRGMLLKEISRVIQEQKILHFVPHSVVNGAPSSDQTIYSSWAFPVVDTNNPEKILEKRQVASRCWEACAELDPLEQEVLVRFFGYDEPLVRIAKELDYCRCHISRVKSRALSKLGKLMTTFSTGTDGTINEVEVAKPRSRARSRRSVRHNYTGGRGRRRTTQDIVAPKKSEALIRFLEQAQ